MHHSMYLGYTIAPSTSSTSPRYTTRDSYTDINIQTSPRSYTSYTSTTSITTTPSYNIVTEPLSKPSMSWENFVLINVEMDRITAQCQRLQADNEDTKIKATMETDQLRQELTRAGAHIASLQAENQRISELESKLSQINLELNSQLNAKTKESEAWKVKYDEMSNTANRYSNLHENIRKENEKFSSELVKAEQVATDLENFKTQTAQLKKQLSVLTEGRERLNAVISDKEQEIKELKKQVSVLEKLKTDFKRSEQERKQLKGLWEDTKGLINNLRSQVSNLASQLIQEENKASLKELEGIDGFKEAVEKLETIKEKVGELLKEKEETGLYLYEKENELKELREEVENLFKLNEDKEKEMDRLKVKIGSMMNNLSLYKKEKDNLDQLLADSIMQTKMLEAQVQDLVDRSKHGCCRDAARVKQDQLQSIKEENEFKVKQIRLEAAQKKLNALATEKSRLTVTNSILSENIMDKVSEKRRGFGKLTLNNSTLSRISTTPKSSRACLGFKDKKDFSEYMVEEEDVPPIMAPKSARNGDMKSPSAFHVAMEKEKQISELNQKIGKYEQQIKELTCQKLSSSESMEQLKTKEGDSDSSLSERMKTIEEVLVKVREIEVELSLVILQAKNIILASENEEINKMLGQKVYSIDEWKAKFMNLDRMFTGAKETVKANAKDNNRANYKNPLKNSYFVSGGFATKTHRRAGNDGKIPLNMSGETLSIGPDSSPLFDSKIF